MITVGRVYYDACTSQCDPDKWAVKVALPGLTRFIPRGLPHFQDFDGAKAAAMALVTGAGDKVARLGRLRRTGQA